MEMEIHFPKGLQVQANYKDFQISTDQNKRSGGSGKYPDPFTLFISSIGTCTGIYVLRFCQLRDIPTKDLYLSLKTKKNEDTGLIGDIDILIHAGKDFPIKYKEAVMKVASKCTVKKHLEKPPSIHLSFSEDE